MLSSGKGWHCHECNVAKPFKRSVRFCLLFLVGFHLQAFVPGESQVVTLNFKDAPLQKVLGEIKKQTGYSFVITDVLIGKAKLVNVNISNTRITEALAMIFQEQPLTYTLIERIIIIKEKSEKKINKEQGSLQSLQPMDVHGRVLNEHNDPVAGVTIRVKGSDKIGTYTDGEGEFVLKNVDPNVTLVLTAVNITSIEAKVDGRKYLDLKVKGKTAPLDEVQVIAYGKTSQRFNVGNTATIKAEDIEKQPVKNPLLALQGRVPGLEVTPANGLRGSGVTIRIQGTNSLFSGNDPLILIDGVPYASQTLTTTSVGNILLGKSGSADDGFAPGGAGSPLNYINPSDIESIDVLKDADATAIYGSRAANGAILITTKKGKAGNTQLDLNLSQGWGKVPKFMDVLNTQQYLEMRREAFKNDGVPIPSILTDPANTDYDVNGHWDTTRNANWQKELIGGTARYTNVILTVSGGTANTQFRLSGTYNRMSTVFFGNSANPSKNLGFSLNNISQNKRFSLQFSGSYMDDLNTLPGADFTGFAITLSPNAPALYKNDGSLNWAPNAAGVSTFTNPLTQLEVKYKAKTTNLVSNLTLGYKLMEGLELRTSLGYTNQQINEYMGFPLSVYAPEQRLIPDPSSLRAANYSNSNINSWIIEPQLSYQGSFGSHKLNFIMGGTAQQRTSNGNSISGFGYTNDVSLEDPKAASSIQVGSTVAMYKYMGVFGRLSYSFKDKYLMNLTARRDGSSRFGPGNRFHNFGAIGAGWIFSEEGLIRKNLRFLSFGKIRGSIGTTGNDQIGDYTYIPQFAPYIVGVPYQGTAGYTLGGLLNPHLEWEETRKLQVGIDLGFFKDRVLITANYALNRCSNQLMEYNLPRITGAETIKYNFPATLQNKSIELAFRTVNYRNASIEWASSFNITFPNNKLVSFPNIETSSYGQYLIIGKPFNIAQLRKFVGVDPLTGIFLLQGKNGPTSIPAEVLTRIEIIDLQPKYAGGFQNNISYKQLQFGMSFQFVKKPGKRYYTGRVPGNFNDGSGNQPTLVLNRWQKPGDMAAYQKFSQNSSLNRITSSAINSDYAITDASFIRLGNVSLSWQLPKQWVSKAAFRSASLYIHAQNLFTITPYKGWNPEGPGSVALPQLRLITIGVQATL